VLPFIMFFFEVQLLHFYLHAIGWEDGFWIILGIVLLLFLVRRK
jgi:hypothetical protein